MTVAPRCNSLVAKSLSGAQIISACTVTLTQHAGVEQDKLRKSLAHLERPFEATRGKGKQA